MPKIELPPRKVAQYLRDHGLHCPRCGSADLHTGELEMDDNWMTIEATCGSCAATWADLYRLAGILNDEVTTK